MFRIKSTQFSHFLCPILFFVISFLSNANQLLAQQKNDLDEKRKTIVNTNDTLVKLSNHVFAILSYGKDGNVPEAGNIAVYENPNGLVLVDAQWVELSPKIKKLLATVSKKPIKYVLNTHYHFDHTDGNKVYGKHGSVIISHENVRKRLNEKQVLSIFNLVQKPYPFEALPFITFSDSLTLNEPNESIKVYHVHNAHTDGDSFIEFMNSNIIHTGDVFVRYGFPYIDNDNGGNIYGMIEATTMLINYANDSTIIIPGHGPISNKKDLVAYRNMLVTVVTRIQDGIEKNLTIKQIGELDPLKNLNLASVELFNLERIYSMVKMKLKLKE